MSTAYVYVRFSSKKQEQGDSVERQLRLARAYAARHALTLDERSYQDLGISAFKGKNLVEGALGTFLNGVKQGVIPKGSFLLVESLDRVSREEILEALDTFLKIIRQDIVLVTLMSEVKYTKAEITKNPGYLMMAVGDFMRAYGESETKSRRVREAWEAKRKSGAPMTAMGPAWLELVNGKWKPIKDKIHVVREAFKLAASGKGTPTIAEYLNKNELRPLGGKAEFWTPELVMALLRNRAVVGDLVSRNKAKPPIEGYYPEVVKPETFNLVQSHINERRRTGGRQGGRGFNANLLSGRLFCACGSKMRYVSSNKTNIYVRCLKAYSKLGCDARSWPYQVLEEVFLEQFFLMIPDVKAFTDEDEPDQRLVLQTELEQKEKALQNLIAVASAGATFSGGTGALASAIAKAQSEVDALQGELRTAPGKVPMGDFIDAAMNLWDGYQRAKVGSEQWMEARARIEALVRTLVDRVVLEKQAQKQDFGKELDYGTATLEAGKRKEVFHFTLPPQGFQKGNVRGRRA